MTLLEIIQEFCRRIGYKVPGLVAASVDAQTMQLMALMNELCEDLSMTRAQWTAQTREASHTSVAALDQGAMETIAPGYLWSIENSFFDRTSNLRLTGPLSPAEWQQSQAVSYTSAYHSFRMWQKHFYIYPIIAAGHEINFEYVSKNLVYDADTLTFKQYFTKDTDTFALESVVLLRGLRYLLRKEKGLPYAEEFSAYEAIVESLTSHDGVKPDIVMSGGSFDRLPGIFIPDSDWDL